MLLSIFLLPDDSLGQGGLVRKLKDERNTLQTLTVKLNAELSRYQAKFRPLTQTEVCSAYNVLQSSLCNCCNFLVHNNFSYRYSIVL